MTRVVVVVCALAIGCVVQSNPPTQIRPAQPIADQPSAAPTAPIAQPAPVDERSTCTEPKLRERAFCLSKIERESAISELLEVAIATLTSTPAQSISAKEDFVYAAENAGIVAAKTSITRLVALVTGGDSTAQRFALIALRHALSLLRMGYAHGGDRDSAHRTKIVGQVGDLCRERLASHEEPVVIEAFRCLSETKDPRHAPAIVKAVIARDDRASLTAPGVRALAELSLELATVRPLVRLLENPLPDRWSHDDLHVRTEVCRLLSRHTTDADRWAHLPAKTAAERIGNKNSQAREACDRLAAKTGAAIATDRALPKQGRNWYVDMPLEQCRNDRYGILGSASLCVVSSPAGASARKFTMTLADTSKLDPKDNTKHLRILDEDLGVKAGDYVQYEQVASYELSDGFWLIVVPIVDGVPDQYAAKYTHLYLLDTANKKWSIARKTKMCRSADCRQDVQLRRKKDALPVDIMVEGEPSERYAWDGKTLKRQ